MCDYCVCSGRNAGVCRLAGAERLALGYIDFNVKVFEVHYCIYHCIHTIATNMPFLSGPIFHTIGPLFSQKRV